MVRIRSYVVRANGLRATEVTLPPEWVEDQALKLGDRLDLYRTADDCLLIKPAKVRRPKKGDAA